MHKHITCRMFKEVSDASEIKIEIKTTYEEE